MTNKKLTKEQRKEIKRKRKEKARHEQFCLYTENCQEMADLCECGDR